MKVKVISSPHSSKEFTVELNQGAQYFRLDYTGNKTECQWMAKMFRTALKKALAEEVKPVPKTRKHKPAPVLEIEASTA
jgi:hypothetical protein